jgi:hypothetical protein
MGPIDKMKREAGLVTRSEKNLAKCPEILENPTLTGLQKYDIIVDRCGYRGLLPQSILGVRTGTGPAPAYRAFMRWGNGGMLLQIDDDDAMAEF